MTGGCVDSILGRAGQEVWPESGQALGDGFCKEHLPVKGYSGVIPLHAKRKR